MNSALAGLNSKTLIGNIVVWLLWSFAVSHGIAVPEEAALVAGGAIGLKETARRFKGEAP